MSLPSSSFISLDSPPIEMSIPVETMVNDGIVYDTKCKKYTRKCIFYALCHGIYRHYPDSVNTIDPYKLMEKIEFLNETKMIDTSNNLHRVLLTYLINDLKKFQVHFFVGKYYLSQKWYTTITPCDIIGTGSKIIRILNEGDHFEYITTDESKFVSSPAPPSLGDSLNEPLSMHEPLSRHLPTISLAGNLQHEHPLPYEFKEEKKDTQVPVHQYQSSLLLAHKLEKENKDVLNDAEIARQLDAQINKPKATKPKVSFGNQVNHEPPSMHLQHEPLFQESLLYNDGPLPTNHVVYKSIMDKLREPKGNTRAPAATSITCPLGQGNHGTFIEETKQQVPHKKHHEVKDQRVNTVIRNIPIHDGFSLQAVFDKEKIMKESRNDGEMAKRLQQEETFNLKKSFTGVTSRVL